MVKDDNLDINVLQQREQYTQAKNTPISEVFIDDNMPMVKSIASSIQRGKGVPSCIDYDDLVSWGVEGLIQARKKFKDGQGAKFQTYAYPRIRGEIFDKIREEWKYRNPNQYNRHCQRIRDKVEDVSLGSIAYSTEKEGGSLVNTMVENVAIAYMLSLDVIDVESDTRGTENPEVKYIDQMEFVLWEEVANLSEQEQKIVELFYVQGLKQNEISETLSYSKSKVCRLNAQILLKLKRRLEYRYKKERE